MVHCEPRVIGPLVREKPPKGRDVFWHRIWRCWPRPGLGGARTITAFEVPTAPVPLAFVAATAKVYDDPPLRLGMLTLVDAPSTEIGESSSDPVCAVMLYPVIAEVPDAVGTDQETVA